MKTLFKTLILFCALALTAGAQSETNPVWTGDLQKLHDYLKAQGAPDEVIIAALRYRESKEVGEKRVAILYPNGLHRWSGRSTESKIVAKVNDLYTTHNQVYRDIMGNRFDLMMVRSDPVKNFMWGDLTESEIVSIKLMEDQYDRIRAHQGIFTGILRKKEMGYDEQFNTAYERDVRARLPADKAEDFLTFNGPIASVLKQELVGVECDEATYRKLLAETRNLRSEVWIHIDEYQPTDTRRKQIEMYQSILGDKNALIIAVNSDATFKALNSITEGEPSQRLHFFYDYLNAMNRIMAVRGNSAEPSIEEKAKIKIEQGNFYKIIENNFPQEKLESFMQTKEGQFLKKLKQSYVTE